MGSAASAGLGEAVKASSAEDMRAALAALSPEDQAKVQAAMTATSGGGEAAKPTASGDAEAAKPAAGAGGEAAKPTVLFVLGGPGAGKGTQCAKIIEAFKTWGHISAGDCLRAERNNPDSADGELINAAIKDGKIVPVAITVKLLGKAMDTAGKDGKTCFLIDGFPRNMENVTGWNDVIGSNANVAGCLFYEASEDELVKRLMGRGEGRDDDNMETIKKRFATYVAETMPIVDLFKSKGTLKSINGMQGIEDVWGETQKYIKEVEAM